MFRRVHVSYVDTIQFVFENGDKMPEGFYIELMNLIKKIHLEDNGENLNSIHTLLEKNKNVVDKNILKVLSKTFHANNNVSIYNFLKVYYYCSGVCLFGLVVISILFGVGFAIIWSILNKK
jgi:hypothetical protein